MELTTIKQSNMFSLEKENENVSSEFTKEFAESINIKLGYGLYVSEDNYEKYVKGNELKFAKDLHYGYILVVRKGDLDFFHYGPKGLTELNPSTFDENENLSFCEGVYCFSRELHKPIYSDKCCLYFGSYSGCYVECVCDVETDGELVKDFGPSKEFVLISDEPVKVSVYDYGVNAIVTNRR